MDKIMFKSRASKASFGGYSSETSSGTHASNARKSSVAEGGVIGSDIKDAWQKVFDVVENDKMLKTIIFPGIFIDIVRDGFETKPLTIHSTGIIEDPESYDRETVRDMFRQALHMRHEAFIDDKRNRWEMPSAPRALARIVGSCPDTAAAKYVRFLKDVLDLETDGKERHADDHDQNSTDDVSNVIAPFFLEGMSDAEIEKLEIDQFDIPAEKWRQYTKGHEAPQSVIFNKPDITKDVCDVYHVFCVNAEALRERGEYHVVSYNRTHAPKSSDALFSKLMHSPDAPPERRIPDMDFNDVAECTRCCSNKNKDLAPKLKLGMADVMCAIFAIMISCGRRKLLGTTVRSIAHQILFTLGGKTVFSDNPCGKYGPMEIVESDDGSETFILEVRSDSVNNLERTFRGSRRNLTNMEALEMGVKYTSVRTVRKANRLMRRWGSNAQLDGSKMINRLLGFFL